MFISSKNPHLCIFVVGVFMIPSSIWHAVVTMYIEYTPCSKLIYYKYVFYRLINTNIVTITMNADIGSYKVNPCE